MTHPVTEQLHTAAGSFRRNPLLLGGMTLVGVLIVLFVVVVVQGWYPIMFVNGAPISAARFERNYKAAVVYYNNLRKSTDQNASATLKLADLSPGDMQVAVLDQLVSAVLVRDSARKEVGSELDGMVREKVNAVLADPSVARGIGLLYGMTVEDFRNEVLVPQAERDILAGRLFWRSEDADLWLQDARTAARVNILSPKFRWDGKSVVAN